MKGRNHSDHPWPGNTWQTKPRRPRYRPKVWPDGLFGTFKVGEMAIKKRDFRCISHGGFIYIYIKLYWNWLNKQMKHFDRWLTHLFFWRKKYEKTCLTSEIFMREPPKNQNKQANKWTLFKDSSIQKASKAPSKSPHQTCREIAPYMSRFLHHQTSQHSRRKRPGSVHLLPRNRWNQFSGYCWWKESR